MTAPRITSEVEPLHTVLLHTPGRELSRLTPRNNDTLLFDGIPWVRVAQEEHQHFAEILRTHGVEVLYLTELLTETLRSSSARTELIDTFLADPTLGVTLRKNLSGYLNDLSPAQLTETLCAGVAHTELPLAPATPRGVVYTLLKAENFLLSPLPNLLFTRDSSVCLGSQIFITRLNMPARSRETLLTRTVYTHHPRFQDAHVHELPEAPLEGGDVLALGPGVVAIGVGERSIPAGAEYLTRYLLQHEIAHTVLLVPIAQSRATMHLDTVCTMVDHDAIVVYANAVNTLTAFPCTLRSDGDIHIGENAPFLALAAEALGHEKLRVITTGRDPVIAEREQWDDGNNTLCIGPSQVIAYARNTVTNTELERAGVSVLPLDAAELGSGRGGPRCMSAPLHRGTP